MMINSPKITFEKFCRVRICTHSPSAQHLLGFFDTWEVRLLKIRIKIYIPEEIAYCLLSKFNFQNFSIVKHHHHQRSLRSWAKNAHNYVPRYIQLDMWIRWKGNNWSYYDHTLPWNICIGKALLHCFEKDRIFESSCNPFFIVKLLINFHIVVSEKLALWMNKNPNPPACSLWWEPGFTKISTLKRSGRLRRRRTLIQRPIQNFKHQNYKEKMM